MIAAVLLVASVTIVVVALVIIVNFYDKRKSDKDQVNYEYDDRTGTFYDPKKVTRVERNGVISFKSKDES